MSKFIKYVYISTGFISLGLGIIGAFLPVMPTVPFLLVTAYCFGKGSKKFNDWFISTQLYKKYLENFIRTKAMPLKMKVLLLTYVSILMAAAIVLAPLMWVKILLAVLIALKYYVFIFKIKTLRAADRIPLYLSAEE